jgi:hypothetical protein
LLNTGYFGDSVSLAVKISSDIPFHPGSTVNTTAKAGINADTVPKQ